MKSLKRRRYLTFGAPWIQAPEIREIVGSLKSGWIGTGPKVARFEERFRKYIGCAHAVAVNSCTAALHLSLLAADLKPGDEVISTPMTFAATINSIIHAGATPVLVDCDPNTGLIDLERAEGAITPKTRAILPVHLHGRPCDMDALSDIASRRNLTLIEDAAHAIESAYRGKKIGAISPLSCFSFYVTKNMTTAEGGMVTTDSADLANKIKIYALHGMSQDAWRRFSDKGYKHYEVVYPGFKYNMTDLQAAIGIHQIPRLGKWLRRRNSIWKKYLRAFADLPLGLPAPDAPDTVHARHLFAVLIDKARLGLTRDHFMQRLHGLGIGTGVHYVGVHLHPYYRDRFGYKPEDFPNATRISEQTLSLPLSPKLSDKDVADVIRAVRRSCHAH